MEPDQPATRKSTKHGEKSRRTFQERFETIFERQYSTSTSNSRKNKPLIYLKFDVV